MRLLRLELTCWLLALAKWSFPGQSEHGLAPQRFNATQISRHLAQVHAREGGLNV